MRVDNPMTQAFLTTYPVDAARVLEQLSRDYAIALLGELTIDIVAPVIGAMLPEKSAAILSEMEPLLPAKILAELPLPSAARIYRLLDSEKQTALTVSFGDKKRRSLLRYLTYASTSAGAIVDPCVELLPENITVADAIRRVEHNGQVIVCDIYIVNDSFQLTGVIELGQLLVSKHHLRLRDVMSRKTQAISVHANISTLPAHPGWAKKRQLPVVERDKTIVGVLDHRKLQEILKETGTAAIADPLDNLLSMVSLYWISLAQLLDSLLSVSRTGRGEK